MEENVFIDGEWRHGRSERRWTVVNPATGTPERSLSLCDTGDLDDALEACERGFYTWRAMPAYERAAIMHKAASLLRERSEAIARSMTLEQGKPLAQARGEVAMSAEHLEWNADEGRRAYGRIIPSRIPGSRQSVLRQPVGPVAAFTPWNFPLSQLVRKVAGALGAGCSIIAKPPEETPSAAIALAQAFHDAGLPRGVLNLVFGVPAVVSEHLLASPVIRKISFTGSIPVGRQLSALAGQHLKRATMELGGHAPFIVANDAQLDAAVAVGVQFRFFNAGQVCASASRFFIEDGIYDAFREAYIEQVAGLKVGNGLEADSQMGPLANVRRLDAMQGLVADATEKGARLDLGGSRLTDEGCFFAPTVLSDVPGEAAVMRQEPFGPIAALCRVADIDEAIAQANALPYGLAAYAFSTSDRTVRRFEEEIDAGAISINHFGLGLPETPFGGVKDSGFGSEGGTEGLEPYLISKFISHFA